MVHLFGLVLHRPVGRQVGGGLARLGQRLAGPLGVALGEAGAGAPGRAAADHAPSTRRNVITHTHGFAAQDSRP